MRLLPVFFIIYIINGQVFTPPTLQIIGYTKLIRCGSTSIRAGIADSRLLITREPHP